MPSARLRRSRSVSEGDTGMRSTESACALRIRAIAPTLGVKRVAKCLSSFSNNSVAGRHCDESIHPGRIPKLSSKKIGLTTCPRLKIPCLIKLLSNLLSPGSRKKALRFAQSLPLTSKDIYTFSCTVTERINSRVAYKLL